MDDSVFLPRDVWDFRHNLILELLRGSDDVAGRTYKVRTRELPLALPVVLDDGHTVAVYKMMPVIEITRHRGALARRVGLECLLGPKVVARITSVPRMESLRNLVVELYADHSVVDENIYAAAGSSGYELVYRRH